MSNLPNGSGASNTLFEHSKPNNPKSSKFDLSRIVNLSAEPGAIIPVDVIPCLPGDRHNISCRFALDTLPLINASLTQYKVTTHWYYIKYRDLWKGWQTFSTKGRSGNVNLTIPKIDLMFGFHKNQPRPVNPWENLENTQNVGATLYPLGHHSLSSYLGVPSYISGIPKLVDKTPNSSAYIAETYLPYTPHGYSGISSSLTKKLDDLTLTGYNQLRYVNALPFMAYQNIVKNNYVNQNLLQDCHALFPVEGDDDWLLPYNASTVNYVGYSANTSVNVEDNALETGVYKSNDNVVRLDCLRYAMFDDDYFTTGLPWLQRGEVQTLDSEVNLDTFTADLNFNRQTIDDGILLGEDKVARLQSADGTLQTNASGPSNYSGDIWVRSFLSSYLNVVIDPKANIRGSVSLTANKLRELIALSVWQERNAQVDGSYNRMIFQHWSVNPHSEEHKATYIGGTFDYVQFNTILQSSESTSNSPLGATAGYGNSRGNGFVGNFYCEDYGYIIGLLIIKPNTTYQQGVEHFLCCENTFEDFPQPEFEGLSPQPILNKEIYVTGNDKVDNTLFAYQERYVYLKVRQNVNRGLFLSAPSKDNLFSTFTQSRWFKVRPLLSYQFLCMSPDNLRRDFLAYPNLPVFKVQFETQDIAVRQLSYSSTPNTFGF